MTTSYVPTEILRNLPYEFRCPIDDFDELEMVMEVNDKSGWTSSNGTIHNCIGMND